MENEEGNGGDDRRERRRRGEYNIKEARNSRKMREMINDKESG